MSKYKNFLLLISFALSFSFFILAIPSANSAENKDEIIYYDQNFDLCYTGCAAWKLYWSGDPVWRYVQEYCSMDGTDAAKTLVKFAFNSIRGSADFGPLIQSLYCAGIIRLNIEPRLKECKQTCQANIWSYAPDLLIAHSQDLFYFPDKQQLQIRVTNGGNVYSPNFKADIYAASTDDRSCQIDPDDWEKIDSYTIDELAPLDVKRNGLNIPSQNTHTLNWQAPAEQCSQVKILIDPDNRIPELGESDGSITNNQYILTINNLPELPNYKINNIQHSFLENNLDDIKLSFELQNIGEMTGRPKIEVKDCYGDRTLRAVKTGLIIEGKESKEIELNINDLFWPLEPTSFRNRCLEIDATDENGTSWNRHWLTIFSASISGRVLDMKGQPVGNATVALDDGTYTVSDENGFYNFTGLTKQGKFILTATHPDHDQEAKREINLTLDTDPNAIIQPNLNLSNIDLILFDQPASLQIDCPVSDYFFRLNGEYFSYQGFGQSSAEELSALVPGEYQLILYKPGYSTKTMDINLAKGESKSIKCDFESFNVYLDDKGINFKPELNDLWEFKPENDFHPLAATISGDASTIYIVLGNNHSQDVKLLVFNQAGQKLAEANIPEKAAYEPVYLQSSYNGNYVLIDAYLLFNRKAQIVSRRQEDKGRGIPAIISWDGSLICAVGGLYNNSFTPLYTGVWGGELDKPHTRCRFGQFPTFTSDGQIISQCEDANDRICRLSFWDGSQYPFLNLPGADFWRSAISPDGKNLLVAAHLNNQDQAIYLNNGKIVWQKPIDSVSSRLSISPEGSYAVVLEPHGKEFALRIFDQQGNEVVNPDKSGYNYYTALASGQGIFYVRYDGKVHFGVFGQKGEASKQNLAEAGFSDRTENKQIKKNNNSKTNNYQAEVNAQTKSLLGKLWQSVKSFLKKIFNWIFK